MSTSGTWSWAIKAGGTSSDYGKGIAVDLSGDLYITGSFAGSAGFGSIILSNSGFSSDIFVAKLSSSGTWLWAVRAGGTGEESGNGIAVNSGGDAYITGYFQDTTTFGSISFTSNGYRDIFVAKLGNNGSWSWVIHMGTSSDDYGEEIAVGESGNAYVIGNTQSDIFVGIAGVDTDGDSVVDEDDIFALESTQQADQDGDGFGDELGGYHGDACPTVFGASWQDRWGCPDMDNDGQSDLFDAFMQNPTQWNDTDSDGLGDNWDGTIVDRNDSTNGIGEYWSNAYLPDPSPLDYDNDGFDDLTLQEKGATGPFDDCPLIYGLSTEGLSGCIDSDGDGWADTEDSHPGDSTQHSDLDGDGYGDAEFGNFPDSCPDEYGESWSDVFGCLDTDEDGISDSNDVCVDTNLGEIANLEGCVDSDGDGYGDNPNGPFPDACPSESGKSELGGYGCPDTDRDGWGDINDAFPTDASQSTDTDSDGYGDNPTGNNPDTCPYVHGNSSEQGILGCPDTDGDGHADDIDDYPEDDLRWSDDDNDGISDQGDDDCPNLAGNSTEPWTGCPDMDGDGIMDLADEDTDGDGVNDIYERTLSEMYANQGIVYDPYDSESTPEDYDGDHIPDDLDDDWDDDGYPNEFEIERGSDAWNKNTTPLNMYGEQDTGFYYKPGEGFIDSYDPEALEISLGALISIITSEYLIPLLMFPFVIFLSRSKHRRFKRFKRRLESVESKSGLEGVEDAIDRMIEKNKVKIQHSLLLRNMFERKAEQFKEESSIVKKAGGNYNESYYDDSDDYDPTPGSSWVEKNSPGRR